MQEVNIYQRELEASRLQPAELIDSLASAQASLGLTPQIRAWSFWIKLLRRVVSAGTAAAEAAANNTPDQVKKPPQRTSSGTGGT